MTLCARACMTLCARACMTGGAVYASGNSRVNISGHTVIGGNIAGFGAGLYLSDSVVNINANVTIRENVAFQKGSILYAKGVLVSRCLGVSGRSAHTQELACKSRLARAMHTILFT